MSAPTLPESLADYTADTLPQDYPARHRVHVERAFMAGALAALVALRAGRSRDELMAEVVGFGRAVGTTAERA